MVCLSRLPILLHFPCVCAGCQSRLTQGLRKRFGLAGKSPYNEPLLPLMNTRERHKTLYRNRIEIMSKKKAGGGSTIALNKKAKHEYFLEERFEAGLSLQGWEAKSLRENKVSFMESYVLMKDGEAFLFGCHITPLSTVSTHFVPDPTRTRKLLLHKRELGRIFGSISKQQLTCVPLALYWKNGVVKCEIALAKGKKLHDKRATEKERDWGREKSRILKTN